jgi:hypothetical protein
MQCLLWSVRSLVSALVAVCGALAFVTAAASAEGSVSSLGMGMGARDARAFAEFEAVIRQYNASGERFRIDSHCQSACTMFLAIRNVCVTQNATLLFHAGGSVRKGKINPDTTARMLAKYKPSLRKYVTDNHYMDSFEFHSIPGSVIISRFGYRACS